MQKASHIKLVYNEDDYYEVSGRVLYQTSTSLRVYDLKRDEEIWVDKAGLQNGDLYNSGDRIVLKVRKKTLNTKKGSTDGESQDQRRCITFNL